MQPLLILKMLRQRITAIALATLIAVSGLFFLSIAPSYAAQDPDYKALTPQDSSYKPLTPEEKIDRAYDLREGVGMEEEIFQEKLSEGQNPEKLPNPYKRVKGVDGQEVPETSLLEEAVGKVKELVGQ